MYIAINMQYCYKTYMDLVICLRSIYWWFGSCFFSSMFGYIVAESGFVIIIRNAGRYAIQDLLSYYMLFQLHAE